MCAWGGDSRDVRDLCQFCDFLLPDLDRRSISRREDPERWHRSFAVACWRRLPSPRRSIPRHLLLPPVLIVVLPLCSSCTPRAPHSAALRRGSRQISTTSPGARGASDCGRAEARCPALDHDAQGSLACVQLHSAALVSHVAAAAFCPHSNIHDLQGAGAAAAAVDPYARASTSADVLETTIYFALWYWGNTYCEAPVCTFFCLFRLSLSACLQRAWSFPSCSLHDVGSLYPSLLPACPLCLFAARPVRSRPASPAPPFPPSLALRQHIQQADNEFTGGLEGRSSCVGFCCPAWHRSVSLYLCLSFDMCACVYVPPA